MSGKLLRFLSELPEAPQYMPVEKALEGTKDTEVASALRQFASMPPSTGVLANPVRYRQAIECQGDRLELRIRSFAVRGCVFEEDIVSGAVDAFRLIFVGLFGRFPQPAEQKAFRLLLADELDDALERTLTTVATFMKTFPHATIDVAMQYRSAIRKATEDLRPVNRARRPTDLLRDLLRIHLENAAVAASSSYMRHLLSCRGKSSVGGLVGQTEMFLKSTPDNDPFRRVFDLLLRRNASSVEADILQRLGAIQVHHGSAGSNMVARYFASLHTKSTSDLFTASQMALDCARHFGAITGLTEFVADLETEQPRRIDELIRCRVMEGGLPTFGHPEIAAAGRSTEIEFDPRPAIYLSPLFEAIDAGKLRVSERCVVRIGIAQRMYQIAFVEGVKKPGRAGRLRIAPNTDFGAWIVQEALGIEEIDRTMLSYLCRGFGWMMDVREQLQQPIIRPVIPPDPAIVPAAASEGIIPQVVAAVHSRLCGRNAFTRMT